MDRRVERHREMLFAATEARGLRKAHKGDVAVQDRRREVERQLKMRAMAAWFWMDAKGFSRPQAASRMGISAATLRAWEKAWRKDRMRILRRGKPPDLADPEVRAGVIAFIHLVGPGVGLPTLQAAFKDVARAELERILERYRMTYLVASMAYVFALRWTQPGSVWAIDYTLAPCPIDARYSWVLVVRDLSSGKVLGALPAEAATASVVVDFLRALFLQHGAPLVLKSDNGSHFIAEEVSVLLAAWGVTRLLSPPETPSYNGSVEAGMGSLKTRAHYAAARNDRPGEWTCDDVEEARLASNELGRPRGAQGPTPNDLWNGRPCISSEERVSFIRLVATCKEKLRGERGFLPGVDPTPRDQASLDRESVSRALVALGLLLVRRRRIPPPLFLRKEKKIS